MTPYKQHTISTGRYSVFVDGLETSIGEVYVQEENPDLYDFKTKSPVYGISHVQNFQMGFPSVKMAMNYLANIYRQFQEHRPKRQRTDTGQKRLFQ